MSKHLVSWFEECLRNRIENIQKEKEEVRSRIEYINSFEIENAILAGQIKRAKEEGRTEFDRDKFNKPRLKKGYHSDGSTKEALGR